MVRTSGFHPEYRGFESRRGHKMQRITKTNLVDGSFVFSEELIEDVSSYIRKRMPKSEVKIVSTQKDRMKVNLDSIKDFLKEPNIGRDEIVEVEIKYESGRWSEQGYKSITIFLGGFRSGYGYAIDVMASDVKDRDFITNMSQEIEKKFSGVKSQFGTLLSKFWTEYLLFPFFGMGISTFLLFKTKWIVPKDFVEPIIYVSLFVGWLIGFYIYKLLSRLFPKIVFYFSKRKTEYDRVVKIRNFIIIGLLVSPLLSWIGNILYSPFLK